MLVLVITGTVLSHHLNRADTLHFLLAVAAVIHWFALSDMHA
jgi:hypothetical protein